MSSRSDGDSSGTVTESSKRAYTTAFTKIDATAKLQIIQALESGQPKADIAREYGVHPQTVAYIYKQKNVIIKKYTQRYNLLKEVCSFNLEQNLIEWFEQQYTSGNNITEDDLLGKAKDILKDLTQEFTCIDDWLLSFRTRHNISKYISNDSLNEKCKEDWKSFLKNADTNYVYLGSVCGLSYNLDLNSYLEGKDVDDYVSIFFAVNSVGNDRKELSVVGNNTLEKETSVKSLPVKYYHSEGTQVNFSVINNYLTKWDSELLSQGKSVTLILNIPDQMLSKLQLYNIRVISSTDMNYTQSVLEKIVDCFKYHYRKLHITKSSTYGKDNCTFLDYIHMMAMAWNCVPLKLVQNLCFPPEHNGLHFKSDNSDNNLSIAQWYKAYNFKLNTDATPDEIDKYIFCDKQFACLDCNQLDSDVQKVTEVLTHKSCMPTSAIEAYQAMKRLVSYLQGEDSGGSVMKFAKYLENHIEYGALLQMHQIIATTNAHLLDE